MARNVNVNLEPSAALAYVIGAFLSDGWVSSYPANSQYFVGLESSDIRYLERFLEAAHMIGIKTKYIQKTRNGVNKQMYRTQANSRALFEMLDGAKTDPERLRPWIEPFPWNFLAAYVDGDGSLASGRISFSFCNERISHLVEDVLELVSLHPKRSSSCMRTVTPNGNMYDGTEYKVVMYRQEEIRRFIENTNPLKGGDA
jgi:hypothetical protein